MKGTGGEVLNAVLLIVMMIGFFSIVAATVSVTNNSVQRMIFDEALALRARNIVLLLEKSLDTTWHVSTIQMVFKAADTSIKCGIDDEDRLDDYYWYRYNPRELKTSSCVESDSCGDGRDYAPRIPESDKYNSPDYNPAICYPRKPHLLSLLNTDAELFKQIDDDIDVESVNITIKDINFTLSVEYKEINNTISQNLEASFSTVKIKKPHVSNIAIKTEFYSQLLAAQQVVQQLLLLSDKLTYDTIPGYEDVLYDYSMRYQSLGAAAPTKNATEYMENKKDYIEEKLGEITGLEDSRFSVNYNKFELIVPTEEMVSVWNEKSNNPKSGLVLHYDATISIIEGIGDDTSSCNPEPPQGFLDFITESVSEKGWSFDNDIEFTDEEIITLVKATIQSESSWDQNADNGIAYGLMQITEATAQSQCGLEKEELFDAQKNIECGVTVINNNMENLAGRTTDKENLLKLAIVQYNCGSCIPPGGDVVYEDIAGEMPLETQNYVPGVLGNYICYGGSLESYGGVYYYFDERTRNLYQKPIALKIKAEDYLPVISCAEELGNDYVKSFHYNSDTDQSIIDMVCCNQEEDLLYTCGVSIEGLDENNLGYGAGMPCGENPGVVVSCTPAGFNMA